MGAVLKTNSTILINNSNKMSFHTTTEEIVLSCASNGYKEFSKYSCCRVPDSRGMERTGTIEDLKL